MAASINRKKDAFEEELSQSPDSTMISNISMRLNAVESLLKKKNFEEEYKKKEIIPSATISHSVDEGNAAIATTEQKEKENQNTGANEPTSFWVELPDLVQNDHSSLNTRSTIKVKTMPVKQLPSAPSKANSCAKVPVQKSMEKTSVRHSRSIVKNSPLSNKSRMLKALEFSVFPGPVNSEKLSKAKQEIEASKSKNFLVLFRDEKRRYRGLYTWNQETNIVEKLSGSGPDKCSSNDVKIFYKYDLTSRSFAVVGTKNFISTVDGFTIQEVFWKSKSATGMSKSIERL